MTVHVDSRVRASCHRPLTRLDACSTLCCWVAMLSPHTSLTLRHRFHFMCFYCRNGANGSGSSAYAPVGGSVTSYATTTTTSNVYQAPYQPTSGGGYFASSGPAAPQGATPVALDDGSPEAPAAAAALPPNSSYAGYTGGFSTGAAVPPSTGYGQYSGGSDVPPAAVL